MKAAIVTLVVLLILAFVLGSAYFDRRNQMAIKREAVNAAWSQVDVVLQRRADLIPNLVATVKGFAVHEEQVFSEIAQAGPALSAPQTPPPIRSPPTALSTPRSAACWSSPKTILSSNPTKTSSASRTNLPAPKIASPSNVAAITTLCRTTTPTSRS